MLKNFVEKKINFFRSFSNKKLEIIVFFNFKKKFLGKILYIFLQLLVFSFRVLILFGIFDNFGPYYGNFNPYKFNL